MRLKPHTFPINESGNDFLVEWIGENYRIGISIEDEGGWYFVTGAPRWIMRCGLLPEFLIRFLRKLTTR